MPKGVPVLKREKKSKILKDQMTSIQAQLQLQERRQAQRLKQNIKRLITGELQSINPWWFISFHYRDHHSKEDELLQDVADLKRKPTASSIRAVTAPSKVLMNTHTQRCCFSTKPATRARVSFTLT